jgi:4'-phosphopantetheinyl transferase
MSIRPKELFIKKNEIHLWMIKPDEINFSDFRSKFKCLLNKDELEKSESYLLVSDNLNYFISKCFVKHLLSRYLNIEAIDLLFRLGGMGKPEVVNDKGVKFNLSHTKGLIVCALSLDKNIGCDVEYTRIKKNTTLIAENCFSKAENNYLYHLPCNQRAERFLDLWVLRESYIKAKGQCLGLNMDEFSFTIGKPFLDHKNDNIRLSFSSKITDKSENWYSTLIYPSNEHRIAISVDNETICTDQRYKVECRLYSL